MKERPILFSAPMVRAILEGRKSQTRRVVKLPDGFDFTGGQGDDMNDPVNWGAEDENGLWWALAAGDDVDRVLPCPYGKPGDRLWVRETLSAGHLGLRYAADDARLTGGHADALNDRYARLPPFELEPRSIPSIHMPRWASRITLEVTGVRVERLQDISEADAKAEGVESDFASSEYIATHGGALCGRQFRYAYAELWNQINGAGAYHANPWVWAVEFKRIEATP
jgi:hypothetical protein